MTRQTIPVPSSHYECPCLGAAMRVYGRFVDARIAGQIGRKVLVSHMQSGLGNRAVAALLLPDLQAAGSFIDFAARVAIEGVGDGGRPC